MQDADKEAQAVSLPQGDDRWLAPARLLCTTREGGVSRGPYASNNLAIHVDDNIKKVLKNRTQLIVYKGLSRIQWLNQVHGIEVLSVQSPNHHEPTADAMYTTQPGTGLAILTADCLPVVLADRQGELVAAAHAGWRGLCAGILSELIARLPVPAARLNAFIGPAIGQSAFEVGPEVVQGLEDYGLDTEAFSTKTLDSQGRVVADKYQVDLAMAAKLDLNRAGVSRVSGGAWCTFTDRRFYSWRRESQKIRQPGSSPVTGRQATIVWLPAAQ